MNHEQLTSLAQGWVAYWKAEETSPEREALSDISEIEWTLVRKTPSDAWQLILHVLELDKSSEIQEILSAGPLEDLLSYHGETMIELALSRMNRNVAFAQH